VYALFLLPFVVSFIVTTKAHFLAFLERHIFVVAFRAAPLGVRETNFPPLLDGL